METKCSLSERDIITKYILPAIEASGWDKRNQIREEVSFTAGRIFVKGKLTKRGEKKRADIIIYYKSNIPVAVVEAKDNKHTVGAGMQQALEYADTLDIPVAISSNGDGFVIQYRRNCGCPDASGKAIISENADLDHFPTPSELWECYKRYNNLESNEAEKISLSSYFFDAEGRAPRYYQRIAINRTVEAIARGQNRILLVMATGTGKTYTAFQIIYRLWKAGCKKRILYLADRNNLITQTKKGDFKHFKDKCHIIRHKHIDKSYEIYLALYQGLTNYDEETDAYKQFSPDFFDLIIVDECHRGSVDEDKAWHKILSYFSSATQIGMTATPKETKALSNIEYFGEPIYTYSLKQGIDDGFLAPYKVLRVGMNVDLEGYRPEHCKTDISGELVEDRLYNTKDFDRNIVIDERTNLVAKKIMEYLTNSDPMAKTIVFCVDIEHAERMRQALLSYAPPEITEKSDKYIVRITGDDPVAKGYLESFINPEERFPVIATTSKLMTTGTDAKTCKLIVLDSNIGSMTEFKQIIGRGTRVEEDLGKLYFTIIDFRNVTDKFADKDFDGAPVKIKVSSQDDKLSEEVIDEGTGDDQIDPVTGEKVQFEEVYGFDDSGNMELGEKTPPYGVVEPVETKKEKVYVAGVDVSILSERRQFLDANGKLITCSLKEFTKTGILTSYRSLDNFLQAWNDAEKKRAIIEELENQGIIFEELKDEIKNDLDIFDLICHIAWDAPALTRKERAENVRKRNYWTKYGDKARNVLNAILDKYAETGIEAIEDMKVLTVPPITDIGTPKEIIDSFGGKPQYLQAIRELEAEIYKVA
ncbi:EcoAI/FtnUII family type I restriction enzme subunit R [Treponema porcinum]|uniref:EcoAI/FtnUII family type I restriction enzme subunit R n=1 Tax=Treponema porcinum TaxID=261392 RepID=UPI0023558620|nr:DEAD/DEAH box helicase family protein [Treponema porcinum]MCI6482457.1 DEAD/DEAH box helicase family protein [Treponema porcinum]MDY5817815.1 DEAD/DEAH box helicase family protein [Treponema sp.]